MSRARIRGFLVVLVTLTTALVVESIDDDVGGNSALAELTIEDGSMDDDGVRPRVNSYTTPFSELSFEQQSLWMAVLASDTKSIESLLVWDNVSPDFGAFGRSLLHEAVLALAEVAEDTLRLLIEHCHDLNTPDKNGDTPLHWAIASDTRAVRLLLQAGANVNSMGSVATPLSYAIYHGAHVETLQLLVTSGADVEHCDARGVCPVHAAAAQTTPFSFRFLIESGGEPFRPDNYGCTSLHYAVTSGCLDTINYLLDNGAELDRSCGGSTPLHLAVVRRRFDIFYLLLAHGANIERLDRNGNSARSLYLQMRGEEVSSGTFGELAKSHVAPAA